MDFPYNISIDNVPLERKQHTKFLGVFIDENLNWNQHIRHITTCISIEKLAFYTKQKIIFQRLLSLCYTIISLILPYITYCNLIWATGAKTKLDHIHLLQKKAIRICTGSQYLAHTNPLFNELKTLNVFHINSLQSLLFMFKII